MREIKQRRIGHDLMGFRSDINNLADSLLSISKKQKGRKLQPQKEKNTSNKLI